jgi:hypothetical protein
MANYSAKTLMGNWMEDRLAPCKVLSASETRPTDTELNVSRLRRFLNPPTAGTIATYGQVVLPLSLSL